MTKHVRVVIVGAGIVGCSIAYHLTQLGWKDVLIFDKGELFDNVGSTSHAPGGVVPLTFNKTMSRLGGHSVKIYGSVDPWKPDRNTVNRTGGVELARTPERMEDLKRLNSLAKSYGVRANLVTPEEIVQLNPLLDAETYVGGLHIPDKLIVAGAHVSGALGRDATATGGATFVGYTEVTDFDVKDGRIVGVSTDNPDYAYVSCEQAVICTNIWSPAMSEKIGVKIPLMAAENQYALTEGIGQLAHLDHSNKDHEVLYPTCRDLDVAMYYRHFWDQVGIGSYNHVPRMVNSRDVGETAMRAFTDDDFTVAWGHAKEAMPGIRQAKLGHRFNGMFSFSIDGMPVLGESPLKGVWVAAAIWLTHAGGVGKVMAELMTYGESEWDTRELSINRFIDCQRTERFISIASTKNYREVYDMTHPNQPTSAPRNVRLTPFHEKHKAMKAEFIPSAWLEMPYWLKENERLLELYDDQIPHRSGWGAKYWSRLQGAEHLATRENVAMFDLTGLAIIEVAGSGVVDFMNYLCTGKMDIAPGRVTYTLLCTPSGGIKRDLTVARMGVERYWMFTGNATLNLEMAWVTSHAPKDGSVTVRDLSHSYAAVGVWGPNARKVLEKVTPNDVRNEAFPFYTWQWLEVGMATVYAMRISYAGELGWELHMPMDLAGGVWGDLWEAGREFGLVPAGLGSFRSLRFEKGYRLWGAEIHTETHPYEAGMGWMVKLRKGDFIGRDALVKARKAPLTRKLVTLTLDDPNVVLTGFEPIFAGDTLLGHVTSGNYGYTVGKYIAFGYVPPEFAEVGMELEVEFLSERHKAIVVEDVLHDPKNERMKA